MTSMNRRSLPQVGVISMVLILLALFLGNGWQQQRGLTPAAGQVHYNKVDGTEWLWQSPSGKPKGIVFLAHGCSHSATDWWDKSEVCPQCIGLPEEKRIVKALLSAGYIALAISSQDRQFSRCWTEDDIGPVERTIKVLTEELGYSSLPVFGIGASSGGGFLPPLAQSLNMTAMVVQIMATHSDLLSPHFPPTAFLHMPRDVRTAQRVASNVEALKRHGVPVHDWRQNPQPITPRFFSDRISSLTHKQSEKIYKALKESNLLQQDGFLEGDPRRTDWRPVVLNALPELKESDLVADGSPIPEVLNVAWAIHEITSDFMPQTIEFFNAMLTRRANSTA